MYLTLTLILLPMLWLRTRQLTNPEPPNLAGILLPPLHMRTGQLTNRILHMLSFMFLFVVMMLEFRETRDCGLDGSFFVMMCV
jgi:hypothetical protein